MKTMLTAVLGLFAGFIGGTISHSLFAPTIVRAQAQPSAEIRAQKFVLADENGTARAVVGIDKDGRPAIQADFGKPKGVGRLISAKVGHLLWYGTPKSDILPDLR